MKKQRSLVPDVAGLIFSSVNALHSLMASVLYFAFPSLHLNGSCLWFHGALLLLTLPNAILLFDYPKVSSTQGLASFLGGSGGIFLFLGFGFDGHTFIYSHVFSLLGSCLLFSGHSLNLYQKKRQSLVAPVS